MNRFPTCWPKVTRLDVSPLKAFSKSAYQSARVFWFISWLILMVTFARTGRPETENIVYCAAMFLSFPVKENVDHANVTFLVYGSGGGDEPSTSFWTAQTFPNIPAIADAAFLTPWALIPPENLST